MDGEDGLCEDGKWMDGWLKWIVQRWVMDDGW